MELRGRTIYSNSSTAFQIFAIKFYCIALYWGAISSCEKHKIRQRGIINCIQVSGEVLSNCSKTFKMCFQWS